MRRLAALILSTGLLLTAPGSLAETKVWPFKVSLDDTPIGDHRFTLSGPDRQWQLISEAKFDVEFLKIPVYRYRHRAEEHWKDGCLASLKADTDDNGAKSEVSATLEAGGLSITHARTESLAKGCTLTFAYWSPSILEAKTLLNPQTGELTPVEVTRQETTTLRARGVDARATRYRLTARGMTIDLWYDPEGHWIGLDSTLESGQILHYRLEG